jgi:hypothetical protein
MGDMAAVRSQEVDQRLQEYGGRTTGLAATVTSAAQDVASSMAEEARTAATQAQEMAEEAGGSRPQKWLSHLSALRNMGDVGRDGQSPWDDSATKGSIVQVRICRAQNSWSGACASGAMVGSLQRVFDVQIPWSRML